MIKCVNVFKKAPKFEIISFGPFFQSQPVTKPFPKIAKKKQTIIYLRIGQSLCERVMLKHIWRTASRDEVTNLLTDSPGHGVHMSLPPSSSQKCISLSIKDKQITS